MDSFFSMIKDNAKKLNKRIVLPEGTEERTVQAADNIIEQGIAQVTLLGEKDEIMALAKKFSLKHIEKATIINPHDHAKKDEYTSLLYEMRKNKGLSLEDARKLVENPLYLGVLMIKNGDADGEVAGAKNATGDVLRPALQIVKTTKGIALASGAFIMLLKDNPYVPGGRMVFADCAVTPNPNAEELAQIAVCSAHTAKVIAGIDPVVSMLSFSTKGSAKHELADKVIRATEIAKQMDPTLVIDGELQADASIVESVAKSKAPGSNVAGKANVLVFPSLEAGNIAYKLVQRLAGAEAIGPVIQGLAAPINDLSRGCSVSDIENVVAIAVNQAGGLK